MEALVDKKKGAGIEVELVLGLEPLEDMLHSADACQHGVFPQTDAVMKEISQA